MSKSVLDALYSVKKCLTDSLSVLSEVYRAARAQGRVVALLVAAHLQALLGEADAPGHLGKHGERVSSRKLLSKEQVCRLR